MFFFWHAFAHLATFETSFPASLHSAASVSLEYLLLQLNWIWISTRCETTNLKRQYIFIDWTEILKLDILSKLAKFVEKVCLYQGWQSYRIEIAPFFPKNIASKSAKNRIYYCISKLNKNNLQLFRFFNKQSTVLYFVVSCDCFIIIMFPGKEKFEVGYDLLHHSAFLHTTWDYNRGFQEAQCKY